MPDEFVEQLERCVTEILDELAPIKHGHRPNGKKAARWLSSDAVNAKQRRRRLGHRWKITGIEQDRQEYRAACSKANKLVNASRNQYRHQLITDVRGDDRSTWSAVKTLLHGE